MGSATSRTNLSRQIADILGTGDRSADADNRVDSGLTVRKSIACGSMALLAINPAPAGAVGLGEIQLKSTLGQPLEAVVPLTLNAGESLPKNCVQPGPANNALGAPRDLRVKSPAHNGPGVYNIRVSTANPLHEPMYELSLMIKCPGVSLLVRQYVLMLDLPGMPVAASNPAPVATPAPVAAGSMRTTRTRSAAPTTSRTRTEPARTLPPRADGIPAGSLYRISRGDTLSTIARRVEGRLPNTIWQVADQLFADNPKAFIRNDPNMIKLGSLLRVPEAAALAAMAPGTSRSRAPATVARQPVASAVPDRATLPTRAPVAVSRNQVSTARRAPVTAAEPVSNSNRWPAPGSAEADAVRERVEFGAAPEPVTTTTEDSATFNPFADKSPEVTVVDETEAATAAAATAPATKVAAADEAAQPEQSTSLLSILFGLLLGGALALIVFRERLLAALGVRRQARPVAVEITPRPAESQGTGTFDASLASAAFDTSSGKAGAEPGLPFTGPVEDTYIVETALGEPTIQEDVDDLRTEAIESDTVPQPPTEQAATHDEDDSAELAKLFDDDYAAGGDDLGLTINEPTAEMPTRVSESLEPTAQMERQDDTSLEPTAEMPQGVVDEFFDPTAELPANALEDVFDPTGGVDAAPGDEVAPTLAEAFEDGLNDLDPDEMFATANHTVEALSGESGADPLDVTINDPRGDALADDATVATELQDLPNSADEDGNLSETLHEALMLLERDFEEEFTASQILERSSLEKSLQEDLEQRDAEPDGKPKRKIS